MLKGLFNNKKGQLLLGGLVLAGAIQLGCSTQEQMVVDASTGSSSVDTVIELAICKKTTDNNIKCPIGRKSVLKKSWNEKANVEAKDGNYIEVIGATVYNSKTSNALSDGIYEVGVDIPSGTYVITSDGGYASYKTVR